MYLCAPLVLDAKYIQVIDWLIVGCLMSIYGM